MFVRLPRINAGKNEIKKLFKLIYGNSDQIFLLQTSKQI